MLAKDVHRKTHTELMDEARLHIDGRPPENGVLTGACPIPQILPYFDYLNGFPIPVVHKLILGVIKSFMIILLTQEAVKDENGVERAAGWKISMSV